MSKIIIRKDNSKIADHFPTGFIRQFVTQKVVVSCKCGKFWPEGATWEEGACKLCLKYTEK